MGNPVEAMVPGVGSPVEGMMPNVTVSTHPLVADRLAKMREKDTKPAEFRQLVRDVTFMLGYEAMSGLPTKKAEIETPICEAEVDVLGDVEIAVVPILRAAVGMVDAMLELLPDARVGYAGLRRNEDTHDPESYYWNMPNGIEDMKVILIDPMLATGGSAIAAIDKLKEQGCKDICMVNIIAAPEGIAAMLKTHSDVHIHTASIDECLNEDAYIVPGLGDAGDRIHGTV